MEVLIKIVQVLMSLSLLVAIHEFGHYIVARIFKIRVEKFYIFFDPWFSLFKWKRGDTEYGIGWVPLGGYVKIAGMIDESMDTEQMAAEPFNNKDYAKAAEIFAQGYAANKQDTDLALNLAMSYCELGDLDKGMGVYKEIAALGNVHSRFQPAAASAKEKAAYYLTLKAQELVGAGSNADAYALIDKYIDVDNGNAQMMRLQAATNAQEWDNVIAWGEATAAAQLTDELKSTAYYLLGAAYDSKDDNAKAIETYEKVVAGDNAEAAKARIAELKAL